MTYEETIYILANGNPVDFESAERLTKTRAAIVGIIKEKQSYEQWYINEMQTDE